MLNGHGRVAMPKRYGTPLRIARKFIGMDLQRLSSIFPGRLILASDQEGLAPFLTDWRGRWNGNAIAAAQPETAEGVAAIVRWCAEHRVHIVPQGGNTGLVGGGVPYGTGTALVLSLTRLAAVRRVDTVNNTITAEAGCLLTSLQSAARNAGRLYPLSLASEGSCTLGGNLATNAGGVQVLRYGNARELCLGIEVVTAEGEIWSSLRGLRKDNTGYDLRDLYIGSEGTLGVITAATMKLYPLPQAQATAMVAVQDIRSALNLLTLAQARLDASVTAFELVEETCIALALKHFPSQCRRPLAAPSPYSLLIETSSGGDAGGAQGALQQVLQEAADREMLLDAAIATSLDQARAFWRLREFAAEAQMKEGPNFKHDIALPLSALAQFVADARRGLGERFPSCGLVVFGHLGDGNLHFNVVPPRNLDAQAFEALESQVNRLVYDLVDGFGGSISAEHGLGRSKIEENERYKPQTELALTARIKHALDPQGLMNPGCTLRGGPRFSAH